MSHTIARNTRLGQDIAEYTIDNESVPQALARICKGYEDRAVVHENYGDTNGAVVQIGSVRFFIYPNPECAGKFPAKSQE